MKSTALWQSIADTLTAELAQSLYAPGDKLPTEAQLAARFGVNRHTVRRALAAMSDSGLIHSRRGAGVFVAHKPTVYPLGKRVRYTQNLTAAGRVPGKEILAQETRRAHQDEAQALTLPEGSEVHVCNGISTADGSPIAVFRSVFPAARFPGLPAMLDDLKSITATMKELGVADYTRASTRLSAQAATATQALHLNLREGAPVLCSHAINIDENGTPVEFGRTWFAGDRVTLMVEDPSAKTPRTG